MIKKMMTAPCSLNTEPYLTEWHADLESGMEIWIQTSEDENNPKWVRLGNLYEQMVTKHIDCKEGQLKCSCSYLVHDPEINLKHLINLI